MIALKKLYGDELLRLALVLSLLKIDPNEYLQQEAQLLTAGLHIANGTDWSLEQEARTLVRPRFVHPKSLDNILINYERQLFEELNSLGRYYNSYTYIRNNNERMSNGNGGPVLHTYLVNNVATDTTAPAFVEAVASRSDDPQNENTGVEAQQQYDGVSDDANVAQEIKVSEEETQNDEEQEIIIGPLLPEAVVTLSQDFLNNRSASDAFTEITSRTFDVSEFLVSPNEMHIKKEPIDSSETEINLENFKLKKEFDHDDLYSDNAMDDFVSYFAEKSHKIHFGEADTVFDQNISDLQEYDYKDFKSNMEYLDVKQQENFEQYLIENTPLESEVYNLAPIFEEELVLDAKRGRASTSFTSTASSSGVSDMEISGEEVVTATDIDVKLEPDEGLHSGDELTQEDMDLIEVLWKQDVDMGFCLDEPLQPGAPQATKVDLGTEIEKELKVKDIEKVKTTLLDEKPNDEDDPWAGLSYTVDTETGEYVLQGDLPRELVSGEESRFDLLEEALQLVELNEDDNSGGDGDNHQGLGGARAAARAAAAEGAMLHPAMARHALPHHHHPLAHYHNQSLMRSMSVEQRWQDLASLLTIPPPPDQYPPYHHQQHPHNISAHAHSAGGGYPTNYGPMAPPPDKHPDVYGASAPLEGHYKMESAHHPQQHDPVYYQNGGPEMGNSDGFLQSILNDEDLQLMDMAMNEGMYTMRMLDGTVAGAAPAHAHAAPPHHTHTHMILNERDSASDSAVSSMGSERVPSLSDGEWCDAGSDSAQEYHSSKFRPYESTFGRDRTAAAAGGSSQPPQKKHHMFGKRCFQEPPPTNMEPLVHEPVRPQTVIKYEYPEHQQHPYHQDNHMPVPGAVEYGPRHQAMPHHPHIAALQPALELNSAHPSHSLLQGGAGAAIGAVGAGARYGAYAGPERVRHNHTYSAPHAASAEPRPTVRDKRARRLTDGSISDGGMSSHSNGHLSRDEKRAKALGIPLEVQDIINLPMDEFNERLSKHDLSEAQLSLIRDIRRRGKNKVAAQNCRKRKLDQITSLADEVRTVRDRKIRTQRDHQMLMAERQRVKERFAALYRHVFQNLRDADGRSLSSNQYSLQQAADGNVVVVPKMPQPNDHPMNRTSDDEMDRKAKNFDQ